MDIFGCCSHYVECSNNRQCLFPENPIYEGCYYNKNLLAGKIFYGAQRGIDKKENIFIDCYDRLFIVRHFSKGYSYALSSTEIEIIAEAFRSMKIPFTCDVKENKCIIEGEFDEPANSRVIFKLNGSEQEYVIANYNTWHILNKYANGIAKALSSRGLHAYVKCHGYRGEPMKSVANVKNETWLDHAKADAARIENEIAEKERQYNEIVKDALAKKTATRKNECQDIRERDENSNYNSNYKSKYKQLSLWDML